MQSAANFFIGPKLTSSSALLGTGDTILIGLLIYYKLKLILIECLPKSARSIGVEWTWIEPGLGLIDESSSCRARLKFMTKYMSRTLSAGGDRGTLRILIGAEWSVGKCFPFKLNLGSGDGMPGLPHPSRALHYFIIM